MNRQVYFTYFIAVAFSAICLSLPATSHADELDLATTPLFLGSTVKPNVFFEVDDSGSMDWEIMTPVHWHPCSYDPDITGSFSSSNCGFEITNGLMRAYSNGGWRYIDYMYRNSDNDYSDDCSSSSSNSEQVCDSSESDWRILSSDLNVIYYNPDLTHVPWDGPCEGTDTACSTSSFTAARSNPRDGTSGHGVTRNLAGFEYAVWADDRGYTGSRPTRGTNINATDSANSEVDLWDKHIRFVVNTNSVQVYETVYSPTTMGLNPTETLEATLTGSGCFNVLGSQSATRAVAGGTGSYADTDSDSCRTLSSVQENVANWYSYDRRRSFVTKGAISAVIQSAPHYRYGLSVINLHTTLFTEVPASEENVYTAHNAQLLANLYSFNWPAAGTPLRQGLENAGKYYSGELAGKADPITAACQQNFAILLTDGFWNGDNPASVISDSDGDGVSRTVADVAHYYYENDISTLENIVAPNAFDDATHQHMVTFTVAFGVTGDLEDTDADGWPNPALSESSSWGNPYYSNAHKINDLWHAAYNSRGTYVGAQTPQAVNETLSAALANISNRVSSATTVAQNSTTLQTDSQVYQARFDSSDWHGQLLAFSIDSEGDISATPLWNANCVLTGGTCSSPVGTHTGIVPTDRVVITNGWDQSGTAIPFRFPSDISTVLDASGELPVRLQQLLNDAPYSVSTTDTTEQAANWAYGADLVNYLRGERSQEIQNALSDESNTFRNRVGILGDIIHSDPVYVAEPTRWYPDSFDSAPYSAFQATHANRQGMVYTGGNDGMLHAFSADNGAELMAYVPGFRENALGMSTLSGSPYLHQYLVDGSPTVADVVTDSSWKTVLVSGMRSGAQGVFGLDISDPTGFSEANAGNLLMFEFSDEDDPDLGYTHAQVAIAKVNTGSGTAWAAIFGNGYNNSSADGYASTSGQGGLFVVLLDHAGNTWTEGSDYFKVMVPSGSVASPNGIGTVYPIDIDGDFVTDYVYGGDLNGNMWRFSMTGAPSEWTSDALFQTPAGQSITAAPIVGVHPDGLTEGVMVYFGSGKYLEPTDNSAIDQPTHSFYGIWDPLDGTEVLYSNLLQQSIVDEQSQMFDTSGSGVADTLINGRRTTQALIDWETHQGWTMVLSSPDNGNQGERQVTRPLLRNNAVIFTTLIPSGSVCAFGGESWIMELDAASGAALMHSPFDFNNNNAFDEGDKITFTYQQTTELAPASGYQSEVGITATPAVFVAASKRSEVKVISGSAGLGSFAEGPVNTTVGRQSWRQVK